MKKNGSFNQVPPHQNPFVSNLVVNSKSNMQLNKISSLFVVAIIVVCSPIILLQYCRNYFLHLWQLCFLRHKVGPKIGISSPCFIFKSIFLPHLVLFLCCINHFLSNHIILWSFPNYTMFKNLGLSSWINFILCNFYFLILLQPIFNQSRT